MMRFRPNRIMLQNNVLSEADFAQDKIREFWMTGRNSGAP